MISWELRDHFSDPQDQSYFHINTKILFAFFHCADMCNEGTETRLNKTAGTLAQIKAEAPMYTNSYWSF